MLCESSREATCDGPVGQKFVMVGQETVMVGQETVMVGQETVMVGQIPTHAHPWLPPWKHI